MGGPEGYLDQLPDVLAYLKQHFPEAARAVLKDLEERGEGESAEVGPSPGADEQPLDEQPYEEEDIGRYSSSERARPRPVAIC
jgi:hypothetical protein